jgi:streptogramin lyase
MKSGFVALGALLLAVIPATLLVSSQHVRADDRPSFVVDPSWPKPLPSTVTNGVAHTWVTGEPGGTCVDSHDNVYTFNRGWEVGATVGGVTQGNLSGAIVAQDASASSVPSPPVVEFNSQGDVITGWGNPSIDQDGRNFGFASVMAQSAHGCFVDYQGFIWFAGSGDGIVQKYDPAAAARAGANATPVLQIGTKGQCDSAAGIPAAGPTFGSCNETTDANTSHTLLNEPADIAVDPNRGPVSGTAGDVYIADGYGNHRIVVFDASGHYVGQWGTACAMNGDTCPPGTFGATGGGHPHCVVLGNDGLVYVCDRPNNRIQVFNKTCAVASTPGNPQPVCQPVRIINIDQFNIAPATEQNAIMLAGTRATDIDFWPNIDFLAGRSPTDQNHMLNVDLGNDNVWVLDKASGHVVGALGDCGVAPCPGHNAGHFAFGHMLASDSRGNVYVSETVTGRRTQKFVPVGGGGNDNHQR